MYDIALYDNVDKDLDALPAEIYDEVMGYFAKYKIDPYQCSQPLYKQGERDLCGCRKTYIANATYRIIIQIQNDVAKIVSVVCVGERQDMTAYEIAFQRISSQK